MFNDLSAAGQDFFENTCVYISMKMAMEDATHRYHVLQRYQENDTKFHEKNSSSSHADQCE